MILIVSRIRIFRKWITAFGDLSEVCGLPTALIDSMAVADWINHGAPAPGPPRLMGPLTMENEKVVVMFCE